MGAKITKVTLEVNGRKQEFEFSHAERLLRLTRAGWHLPEESKYEYVNNGLKLRANKKGVTGQAELKVADGCKTASAED